ncbi:phosphoenolpyruvate--protein phosphotransferase [Mycoplasmatota bacterium zrk1]
MKVINGIPASSGISIAKIFKIFPKNLELVKVNNCDVDLETERLKDAVSNAKEEILEIVEDVKAKVGEAKAMIFRAHILMLEDPEFIGEVYRLIESENINAEFALDVVSKNLIRIFEGLDSQVFKERAIDVKDVSDRVMKYLTNSIDEGYKFTDDVIIVTNDLTPSESIRMGKKYVRGFILNVGGKTSHAAILARALEIPAVVGTKVAFDEAEDGDLVILDGDEGIVIVNPNEEQIEKYRKLKEYKKEDFSEFFNKEAITLDKKKIKIYANIASNEEMNNVLKNGAEGIGLFRTEFIFMGRNTFPSEDEQFSIYKSVLEAMNESTVIIRTLDIGGDKQLPYLKEIPEENPFLGLRAIRLCLNEVGLFKTQLRALLRASAFGNLKIMFPMITVLEEIIEAKKVLEEVKSELIEEGFNIGEIGVGIMIETPSSVMLADKLIKHVDFFSIGTNDLVQYTMAADRMNQNVSYLYQPSNPVILKMIKMVIDVSHNHNKWTGICGEIASDLELTPLLIGLGVEELSVISSSVPKLKKRIGNLDSKECQKLSQQALNLSSSNEVTDLLKRF